MSAAEALKVARTTGIEVGIDGDDLNPANQEPTEREENVHTSRPGEGENELSCQGWLKNHRSEMIDQDQRDGRCTKQIKAVVSTFLKVHDVMCCAT